MTLPGHPWARGRVVAPLALALALFAAGPAYAIDEQSELSVQSQKSLGDYLTDVESDSDPNRLYAARVLRGELRRVLRVEANAPAGSLASLDARAILIELETRLPRACRAGLQKLNSVAPCADILALLGVKEAVPEIRQVLTVEKRRWVRRHLESALAKLEG
ncbi:MAG: hypothetical protein Q8P41_09295 [Pseudomonadota bacterium]|nr:hypothetical protein [Pseudomonadota bacterium]